MSSRQDRDIQRLRSMKLDFMFMNHNILGTNVTLDAIYSHLDLLATRLRRMTADQIEKMIFHVDYTRELSFIKFELDMLIKSTADAAERTRLIRYKDIIFRGKLRAMEEPATSRRVTSAFNKFVQGITYFHHESFYTWGVMRDPLYHRNGSCSKKGTSNFTCNGVVNRSTRRSNAHLIETCYIERLIYDQLWQQINQTQQDGPHLRWLLDTQREYASCHPNMTLFVHLEFFDDQIPVGLHIHRHLDGDAFSHEYYSKLYDPSTGEYEEFVQCIKVRGSQRFTKNSHFTHKGSWTRAS